MFAVIKTGGKQYRVAADDLIEVDKIAGEAGETVAFAEVLAIAGDETLLGSPTVAGATVRGEVVEQGRKPKVIAFKKRRRKNSRRKRGHRQEFTLIRITEILTGAKERPKPAKSQVKPDEAAEKAASVQSQAEIAEKPAPAQPKAESVGVVEEPAAHSPAPKKEASGVTASASSKSRPETKSPGASQPTAAEQDKPK